MERLFTTVSLCCLVGVLCGANGWVEVEDKSNEIVAIPELIALLTLKGAIVTVDAIGCQKKIARAIRSAGADYLLALKKNQEALHQDVVEFLTEQRACGFANCAPERWQALETTDADHGRIEVRRHWITDDIAWLTERHPDWAELTSIGMVEQQFSLWQERAFAPSLDVIQAPGGQA